MSDFYQAIQFVLANEGGLADHPSDRGGLTRYGISKRSYPDLDIENLTMQEAIEIYRRDYWDRLGVGRLDNQNVATKVLDAVVVRGPSAIFALQRALRSLGVRVAEDGVLGAETASAVNAQDERRLLPALRSELAGMFRLIADAHPEQGVFLKGWLNRAYL